MSLLHGLGFSFVLHEILQVTSPNIWQSLLAFNLRVKVGQILIILMTWVALVVLHSLSFVLWQVTRIVIAVGCIIIASVWMLERTMQIISYV